MKKASYIAEHTVGRSNGKRGSWVYFKETKCIFLFVQNVCVGNVGPE